MNSIGLEILTRKAPPGLEYLSTLDRVLIKKDLEIIGDGFSCDTRNFYNIQSNRGDIIFNGIEETDFCTEYCCGPIRPFHLEIKDLTGRLLIQLKRPLRSNSSCLPCCLQEMKIYSPPTVLAGSIQQIWTISPEFNVINPVGTVVMKIKGPLSTCLCICRNVEFKVMSADGSVQVGKISKQWSSGFTRQGLTDPDNFGVSFPVDLNIHLKTVLIGASFMIDYMYFAHSTSP